ncbi:MAG: 4Fe-4S cluster-binding domain-containing protein [Chloroflexi bacterium]|nr:4Fe-4S cluster-binding domain-containing protein [Chloroflexota bacterium]
MQHDTACFEPAYLQLLRSGELTQRVTEAYQHLTACDVCARECSVDRRAGELGVCRTGERARVSSYGPHLGEEDPLRGRHGSGTIFFTGCNLQCQFCQNHDISQTDAGDEVEPKKLASMMLDLQSRGCHNINLVSPSHVIPQILAGVLIAAQAGLRIPLVYNTGGYDSLAMLALLDGVIDIYMPDMKYAGAEIAKRYSKIEDYPQINQAAVRAMHQQVGDLQIDARGIATRGLLVRHLILPHNLAGSDQILRFLAGEISTNTYLNLMDQYRPAYRAHHYPELDRPITRPEYNAAVHMAHETGLKRLDERRASLWGF